MKPFADALQTARTPDDLEAVIVAVNAYFAADPYAVSRTVGGFCSLSHRAEARAARREAYRRLGVSTFVPESFGRTAVGIGGGKMPTAERRQQILTLLASGPHTTADVTQALNLTHGTVNTYLRALVNSSLVVREGLRNIRYSLPEETT